MDMRGFLLSVAREAQCQTNHNRTGFHLSAHALLSARSGVTSVSERIKRDRVTSIANPESAFGDKVHDVPIAAGTRAECLQKCTCVLGHVFQDRRCVSGDGRLMASGRPRLAPACAICGNNLRRDKQAC